CAPAQSRQLRLDGGLVDDGADVEDLPVLERIEDVLRERNLPPVDIQLQKPGFWRTVELQPARNIRGLGNQQFDIEVQIGNAGVVVLQHLAITGQADLLAVMTHLVMHEAPQVRPIPGIQAGDVPSIDAGQIGWGHRWFSVARVVSSVLKTLVQLRAMCAGYTSSGEGMPSACPNASTSAGTDQQQQ